tara:strand:- start:229 stop:987 length:759 start_codon:yes stop_codon:yes gene_type:complete
MNCIFISVRSNSTRLPQKATLEICGTPTIEYLINNLKKTKIANEIVLCTTQDVSDDILCDIATRCQIKYHRGSTEDKLLRWKTACEEHGVDFFVNVDGDDLFFDYKLADLVFQQHHEGSADFIDGRGLYNDVYGISSKGIKTVCKHKSNKDTEFVKVYFDNIRSLIKIEKLINIPIKYHKKNIRMTLDYQEDLDFFTTIIEHFRKNDLEMSFEEILNFLNNNPSIIQINWHKEQNWKDNQEKMIDKIKEKGV